MDEFSDRWHDCGGLGRGTSRKGDYAAAAEAFEKAAVKSKDVKLEAKSRFNLGNCAFREAERQKDSDLNKAVEACGKSIQHYQEALTLDPGFKEAAENIEVVRLIMKNILDEINKQKQKAQQQQEAMKQLEKQIKELIEKQQKALAQNQALQEEQKGEGDSKALRDRIQDLAQDQKDIQAQTEAVVEDLNKTCSQTPPVEENPTKKHLNNAVTEQKAASGNLEKSHSQAAFS